ncbi:hypothetical protein ABE073_04130 [Lederbergia citrisecunda]|uniref:hypothetical protein n=1 Tax=Lederbergia citrisecunda TaxID=2833583 RepID=UPI003D2B6E93
MEWIQTDALQFVKEVNENTFEVLETYQIWGGDIALAHLTIDLNDYDLEDEVSNYYSSLDEVKEQYGNSWKQIVAEIIAENNAENGIIFAEEDDLKEHIKSKYKIQFN